jgi:hypothetical protein
VRNALLFAALFVAVMAVAALTLRARSPDLMLEVTRLPQTLSPNGDGDHDEAVIGFFVRDDEPNATVQIVGRNLRVVRTLDADADLRENEPVTYVWGGDNEHGGSAPPGRYRLRVVMPSHDRDVVFPRQFDLKRR